MAPEEEVPEPPKDPVTRPGDLWLLGEQGPLCGDAIVLADVERVLGGTLADMAWTDPPYNVDYGSTSKDKQRGKGRKILNDDLGDGFGALLTAACTNLVDVTKGGDLHRHEQLGAAHAAAGVHPSTAMVELTTRSPRHRGPLPTVFPSQGRPPARPEYYSRVSCGRLSPWRRKPW